MQHTLQTNTVQITIDQTYMILILSYQYDFNSKRFECIENLLFCLLYLHKILSAQNISTSRNSLRVEWQRVLVVLEYCVLNWYLAAKMAYRVLGTNSLRQMGFVTESFVRSMCSMASKNVGFIGLGLMGNPMSSNLMAKVCICNFDII